MSATVRFNANILAVARRLQDTRTYPTSAGDSERRYAAAILAEYQNKAIKDIIADMYNKVGPMFPMVLPECVKVSGTISLASGVGSFPSDAWRFLEVATSDFSVYMHELLDDVIAVKSGRHGTIVPSATEPVWYQEGRKLYILPTSIASVAGRYIISPTDILALTSVSGGLYNLANGAYTYATKTLVVTMNSAFTVDDVGRTVTMKIDSTGYVHIGRIGAFTNGTTVVLEGINLPGTDVTVNQVHAPDTNADATDVILSSVWDPEIQDRMAMYALADAKNINQ